MHISHALALLHSATVAAALNDPQIPMNARLQEIQATTQTDSKVAIIGSGIAGASAAFRLSSEYGAVLPAYITFYEASENVGGRINCTSRPLRHDDAIDYTTFVDTGAQLFSATDSCLNTAVDNTGLRNKVVEAHRSNTPVGVWNGQKIIVRREGDLKSRNWQDHARDAWKYGTSPRKLQIILDDVLPRIRYMLAENRYASSSLPEVLQRAGLTQVSKQSAHRYFLEQRISLEFATEIIQPEVRSLFLQDLREVNALSALLAMDPATIHRIESQPRGTAELVWRLIRLSNADIELGSRVVSIGKSMQGKYTITTDSERGEEAHPSQYDAVVIATSLENSGIKFDFPFDRSLSPSTPFVERHVTQFTVPDKMHLSPWFLNLDSAEEVPDHVYTTGSPQSSEHHDVYSISRSEVEGGMDGDVVEVEGLYKLTSSDPIPDSLIAAMFGKGPETSLTDVGISWIHREVWPHASHEQTRGPQLNDFELADQLFYTGVGEELLPSMEMSCRMGSWTADLLFRKMAKSTRDVDWEDTIP